MLGHGNMARNTAKLNFRRHSCTTGPFQSLPELLSSQERQNIECWSSITHERNGAMGMSAGPDMHCHTSRAGILTIFFLGWCTLVRAQISVHALLSKIVLRYHHD